MVIGHARVMFYSKQVVRARFLFFSQRLKYITKCELINTIRKLYLGCQFTIICPSIF
jgi:hypothetical protein